MSLKNLLNDMNKEERQAFLLLEKMIIASKIECLDQINRYPKQINNNEKLLRTIDSLENKIIGINEKLKQEHSFKENLNEFKNFISIFNKFKKIMDKNTRNIEAIRDIQLIIIQCMPLCDKHSSEIHSIINNCIKDLEFIENIKENIGDNK